MITNRRGLFKLFAALPIVGPALLKRGMANQPYDSFSLSCEKVEHKHGRYEWEEYETVCRIGIAGKDWVKVPMDDPLLLALIDRACKRAKRDEDRYNRDPIAFLKPNAYD